MKEKNFDAAAQSLDQCRQIVTDMNQVLDAARMEILWSDFLIGSQRVFSKLAAASEGKSAAWFGKIAKERGEDELLVYVHQARHADEHGLEKVASPVGGDLQVNEDAAGKGMLIKELRIGNGSVENLDAENAAIRFNPADAVLHPVKNRGRTYPPPNTHEGKPWTENNAQAVAKAVLAYMEKTVAEGKAFITD